MPPEQVLPKTHQRVAALWKRLCEQLGYLHTVFKLTLTPLMALTSASLADVALLS